MANPPSQYRRVLSLICAALFLAVLFCVDGNAQQVVYDRNVKLTLPSGWIEKRAWEMTPNTLQLPLYNPQTEAVALVHGSDKFANPAEGIRELAEGQQLSYILELELSRFSGASRFYALVFGGFSVRKDTPGVVVVGPSIKEARTRYLGKVDAGPAEIELVEWLSAQSIDEKLAKELRLRSEFVGRKAQCLLGEARFKGSGGGYTLTACRFLTSEEGLEWIRPLLAKVEPVPESEQARARDADHLRGLLREALSSSSKEQYSQALDQLEHILNLAPQDENALDLKGAILVRQEKYAEAETILRRAVAINPDHESARFNLGAALWDQGKKKEAAEQFETVRRINPLYPKIDEVLQEVKSKK